MSLSKCVLALDTSLLCVWLKIPGMETCGEAGEEWDYKRVDMEIQAAIDMSYTLVLPLATIIETGNHIAHASQQRLERAKSLASIMRKAAEEESPWAAFQRQTELWGPDQLRELADTWPPLAQGKLSIGDATIKKIADYYAKLGCEVHLLTADQQLKAYEPPQPSLIPRRRK